MVATELAPSTELVPAYPHEHQRCGSRGKTGRAKPCR